MLLVGITFLLFLVAFVAYWYGAWKLAQFGFRISTGTGIGCLIFPPFALYFSIFKLQEEGKEFPTSMMLFGLVSSVLITFVFWTPLSMTLTGRMDELDAPRGVAEAAVAEYGAENMARKAQENMRNNPAPTPVKTPEPTPTPTPEVAPQGTNNGTGGPTDGAAPTDGAPTPTDGATPKEAPKEAPPATP